MKKLIILTSIFLLNISLASEFKRIEGTEKYSGNRIDCHLVNNGFLDYTSFKFNIVPQELFVLEVEDDVFTWLQIEQSLFDDSSEGYINFAKIIGNELEFTLNREYYNSQHGLKSVQKFTLQNKGSHHIFIATSEDINESMNGLDLCSFTVDLKQIKK